MADAESAVRDLLNANVEDGWMTGFVYNIDSARRAFNHFDKARINLVPSLLEFSIESMHSRRTNQTT